MKKLAIVLFTAVTCLAFVGHADSPVKVCVLDNAVLCVRATRVPENVKEQIRSVTVPSHLAGTVLDLRFADDAATNAADYFAHRKLPLVILVNSQTRGAAASLALDLRKSVSAILIGSTNCPPNLVPDIAVDVSTNEELTFQDNPYARLEPSPVAGLAQSNLLAFVDHTSEAELVHMRIKDGEEDGELDTPRPAPPEPVVRDPALARAIDLLKALAVLHPSRG